MACSAIEDPFGNGIQTISTGFDSGLDFNFIGRFGICFCTAAHPRHLMAYLVVKLFPLQGEAFVRAFQVLAPVLKGPAAVFERFDS